MGAGTQPEHVLPASTAIVFLPRITIVALPHRASTRTGLCETQEPVCVGAGTQPEHVLPANTAPLVLVQMDACIMQNPQQCLRVSTRTA